MMKNLSRKKLRETRHRRMRQHLQGTSARPRFSVYRSKKNLYIQVIDDTKASTLVSAGSLEKAETPKRKSAASEKEFGKALQIAKATGILAAKRALEKGISQVAFDRGGFQFHGRIKAVAEGAREAGLQF